MRSFVVFCVMFVVATPAFAQSTYVGASLVGDVARFSKVDYGDDEFAVLFGGERSADDEALGFNVKIGRAFSERWGLEFEFARSGEFESRTAIAYPAILRERLDLRLPNRGFEYESERSHTTFAALAFLRQELGERLELSYLGGIAFSRVETEHEYDGPRILIYPPVTIPGYETIFYETGPTVGVEAAFTFGAAAVTGGVRLQSAGGDAGSGWLIRPNLGMRWTF